jgi:hypothetical protein
MTRPAASDTRHILTLVKTIVKSSAHLNTTPSFFRGPLPIALRDGVSYSSQSGVGQVSGRSAAIRSRRAVSWACSAGVSRSKK